MTQSDKVPTTSIVFENDPRTAVTVREFWVAGIIQEIGDCVQVIDVFEGGRRRYHG
jgi:hypothetical protein